MALDAKVTSKGQITLPAKLRKELGLKPGDRVNFRRTKEGNYELVAKTLTLEDIRGMIKLDGPPRTIEQIVDDVQKARDLRAEDIVRRMKTAGDES
ncbi:MAG: AbrB/MazE/SpoVT family DNA-binding domain-containing protein [Hyphomicrobiales bacterium]|nr:AbrB/MazE/SpoVT family DNA-binding domain-containing protein [Hyphomicrobiales bacterium]